LSDVVRADLPALLDDVLLESIERVRDAAAMLVPELVGWDAALDHGHQRPADAHVAIGSHDPSFAASSSRILRRVGSERAKNVRSRGGVQDD